MNIKVAILVFRKLNHKFGIDRIVVGDELNPVLCLVDNVERPGLCVAEKDVVNHHRFAALASEVIE